MCRTELVDSPLTAATGEEDGSVHLHAHGRNFQRAFSKSKSSHWAYDVHAIRAFEVHAVDYLLKPYDKDRFAKSLVHARQILEQRREANRDLEPLLRSLRSLRTLERFVVKDNKRIFFVPVPNVLWIEATGNYACIHTASGSHLLRETMAHLEEKLASHHFIRVRKSAIVNGACISEIRPMFDGVYDIVLAGGAVVTSSRRYAHKLRALLES